MVAHGGIWLANRDSRTVARLEPETLELSTVQRLPRPPIAIASCSEAIWVLGSNGWLWRLWPDAQAAEGVARLGGAATAVATAGETIWVLRRNGRLDGLDPASGEVAREGKVPRGASHMLARDGKLWVSCGRDRRVIRFDPETGRADAEIRFPQRIECLALAADGLLVGCGGILPLKRGRLHRIERPEQGIASTVELLGKPRGIAAEDGTAWVARSSGVGREGAIDRVDLGSGEVAEWRATEWRVSDLALVGEELLASMYLELRATGDSGQVT